MKKSKTSKRITTMTLTLLLIATCLTPMVFAAQNISTTIPIAAPRFACIDIFEVDLSIASSGYADCYSRVNLSSSSYSATLTMELQRQSGSTWNKVNSWSTSGRDLISIGKGWYVTSGTYRVKATAQVYSSSGSLLETATAYSVTVNY